MRSQPSHGGEGPTRGTGPLAGSLSGFDHRAHRKELFGEYREKVRAEGLQRKTGNENSQLPDETVLAIHDAANEPDATNRGVADEFGVCTKTVSRIKNGRGRFEPIIQRAEGRTPVNEKISEAKRELSKEQIRKAYRLAHAENGMAYPEIAEACGGMSPSQVGKIKRHEVHRHLTRDLEVG